jgi:hypothetical protein
VFDPDEPEQALDLTGADLAAQRGEVVSRKELKQGAVPGREHTIAAGRQVLRARTYLSQPHLYQVLIEGEPERAFSAENDHYLDSFRLTHAWKPFENRLPREAEVKKQTIECRICLATSSESRIRRALEKALPSMQWEEGDSSWDKIRVWGEGPDATIGVYRYEGPGPFNLRITLNAPKGADAEKAYLAMRDRVLLALNGRVWKPLEPQPVSLIKLQGRFPAAYEFECNLDIWAIKRTLDDADFWSWETRQEEPLGLYLDGGVARIVGDKPSYRIEVGNWQDEPDRIPSCDQVHETVQNSILPAIGARNVRGAK